jgi:8-oxo-dGTP pyrophosphatase MutT (NUDIX family)
LLPARHPIAFLEGSSLKQVGTLPLRRKKKSVEVLLVTSRDTGRWVIPKGWPSKRMTDAAAAAREARQEAGVTGAISRVLCGTYRYRKVERHLTRVVDVDVYILWVKKERKRWREKDERRRSWFPLEKATRSVRERGLKVILRSLTI